VTHESGDPTDTITIQNVVGVADLERELDLPTVAMDLENADYEREQFAGLLYRPHDATATVMTFRSGAVTITGAASTGDMRAAFTEYVAALHDLGIPVGDTPTPEVTNIVATADLGERVNLNAVAVGLGLEHTEYEPEQFPGLVYRLDTPAVVLLLFGSGKLVVTGATDRESIETAVEMVAARLTDLNLLDR
jgi:transcription initiation factor TFIID TATA-box-binding protein